MFLGVICADFVQAGTREERKGAARRNPSHHPADNVQRFVLTVARRSLCANACVVRMCCVHTGSVCVCAAGTFDLLVYTDDTAETPKAWEVSDPKYVANSEEVRLRSFTTKVRAFYPLLGFAGIRASTLKLAIGVA